LEEEWYYLFQESFGSFYWVQKKMEKMGIDSLRQDLLPFEEMVGKKVLLATIVMSYLLMINDVWTMDHFKRKLDERVRWLRTKLDKLLTDFIQVMKELPNTGVHIGKLEETRIADLVLASNYVQNLNTSVWNSPDLNKAKDSMVRTYLTFKFFNGLHEGFERNKSNAHKGTSVMVLDTVSEENNPKTTNVTAITQLASREVSTAQQIASEEIEEDEQKNTFGSYVISDDELTTQHALADQYLLSSNDNDEIFDEEDNNNDA
jgi:hypothetical protein